MGQRTTSDAPAGLVIRAFGGVGVDGADGPISIGGPKQRRLLALLVVRAGNVVTVDWLAEYLWDDDERPEATVPAIRTYLSRLRQALPSAADDWIETVPTGYRLDAPVEAVEHRHFAALRAEARRAREVDDPLTAHTKLDEALALWRGAPFPELEALDWARADIEQLHLDRLEMLEERWEAALALGRHTQITGELATFTAEHGGRDRAAQQYALALHRSGRTAEALRVISDFRRRLADESGLEPSAGMVELEQALLADDPALGVEYLGRPLRGYRLLEEIGAGAFSVVWRGEQPSVQREVAIKQIRSELASQPEFIRRFEAEAHLVARLEHPHIVPLIDYWRDPESAYLVMRWMRGGTLERRLDDGTLTLEETLTVATQIGGALSTAHAHGIVHRDVKTANILFDEQGNAFLADFGIALEAARSTGPEAALSPGSPLYSSPEQLRRELLGPEADVFSLGVVLFECLTGSLPLARGTVEELIDRQLHVEHPRVDELRPDIPRHVADAVARATSKAPTDRFGSVEEFVGALTVSVASSPVGVSGPADLPWEEGGTRENPYLGLRAFDDADSDRFFGRDRLVTSMLDRLAGDSVASRCLVVVGPSGSGKSSVVRAGLLPALRSGAVDGSSEWFSTTMVPGDGPFEALETALLRIAVDPPASLLEQLREGPRGILRTVRRCLTSDDDTLVLLVDQFEEVFLGQAAADADDFLHALAVAVEDPSSPLRLVATLRADYYHRPLEHPTFAAVLTATAVDVTPLAADELERAIVEPAAQLGIGFEPGLVARVAAEAVGQPSPLPLLQYTLSELFDRRPPAQRTLTALDYEQIGGLAGALASRAEALYDSADSSQRSAMRTVFGQLTDPSGVSADLRRRVVAADLGTDGATAWVVEELSSARLLTLDRDPTTREPTVEVAHEALLREWPRLVGWLDEDRDLLRSVASIAGAADTWERDGRAEEDLLRGERVAVGLDLISTDSDRLRPIDVDYLEASQRSEMAAREAERGQLRRLRRLVVGVAAALVVAIVAGGLAFVQQRRADDEAATARVAAEEAELATIISRSAGAIRDDPDVGLLLALEANRRAPSAESEQAILNALGSSTLATQLASFPPLHQAPCQFSTMNSDGTVTSVSVDGELLARDPLSGEVSRHGESPGVCAQWFGDPVLDRTVAQSEDDRTIWVGPFDGPFDAERTFDDPTVLLLSSFRPTGRLFAATFPADGPPEFGLLDDRTLDTVGGPVSGGRDLIALEVNDDGTLVAVSFGTPNRPGGDGELIVADAVTGDELFRMVTPQPIEELLFDENTPQLLGHTFDSRLITVDLESGETVHDVATTATARVSDMEVASDGLVQVVSTGQLETVDRTTGPVSEPVELRGVVDARIRPDGSLLAIEPGGGTSVITLDGNSLVDRLYEVDPFAGVVIRDGVAASADSGANPPELIDLADGERTTLEFVTPDGALYRPFSVIPDRAGQWTIGPDSAVIRWEGGDAVGSVLLSGPPVTAGLSDDRWAILTGEFGGDAVVNLVALEPTGPRLELSTPVTGVGSVLPSSAGGLFTGNDVGVLSVLDAAGEIVREIETGIELIEEIVSDPASGRLAIRGSLVGAALVDPSTGEVQVVNDREVIVNLGFARDGQYLAITSQDGTVRLWDVERGASAGLVWDGRGARIGTPSWYDAQSDSVWVTTSGQLVEVPLDPEVWVERACSVVGRDLTEEEWERLVPGDEPVQSACG
ncbi:MAG: protein kinase [Actinomycetota bacterium]